MSFPDSLLDLAKGMSGMIKSISTSPAGASSRSSSQSTSYVNSQGAGASSSASATSSTGRSSSSQEAAFVSGATSSSASASSSTDDASTSAEVTVPAKTSDSQATDEPLPPDFNGEQEYEPRFLITASELATIETTPFLPIFIAVPAGESAPLEDTVQPVFQIGSEQNDLFRTTNGQDFITGYVGTDVFDLSGDGGRFTDIANADIITDFDVSEDYLLISGGLTIDDLDFRSIDFNGDTVVDSTVIRLGPDGNILAVVLNTVLPVVNGQEQTTKLDSDSSDTLNALVEHPIDYLLGTSADDSLVSDSNRDILVGYGGADTFVLESSGDDQLADADIIIDFNLEEGDVIQLSSEISFDDDIILETVDLDSNEIVESTSIRLTNGTVLAIAQGTVDLLGNTILSTHTFISGADV